MLLLACSVHGQLSSDFYQSTCPRLQRIVRSATQQAIDKDPIMGAAMLRLFFHDCFVNGCDASVLLDDTPTSVGEKGSPANFNSLRGFEVIDDIKAQVEAACPATVSCADILALAARHSVSVVSIRFLHQLRGPRWQVPLGRRDARTAASPAEAIANLPPADMEVPGLIGIFASKGLDAKDMVALSGAHTIGQTRCGVYRARIYNDKNVDPNFAAIRKNNCPPFGDDNKWTPLDLQTPTRFDNKYYRNLLGGRGILHSDQALYGGGQVDGLVKSYSANNSAFFADFALAMTKMGNISPLTGANGEIRLNCRKAN
ncbi:Peroxidase [Musa troglodytarum]|uniref:Peroxidase n=1 Tax=Musa troglodytarum TaxID=320322 RepID=A0A9E7H0A9_9LILI|nr:Peroxidase [Musa troglodytarum]